MIVTETSGPPAATPAAGATEGPIATPAAEVSVPPAALNGVGHAAPDHAPHADEPAGNCVSPADRQDPVAFGRRVYQQWHDLNAGDFDEEPDEFELLTWQEKVLKEFQECVKERRAELLRGWRSDPMTWAAVATRAGLSERRTRELAAWVRPVSVPIQGDESRGVRDSEEPRPAHGTQPKPAHGTQPKPAQGAQEAPAEGTQA
jgi:hypothetical protein